MLSWPQARPSSIISGELLSPGQGATSRETGVLLPLPTCHGGRPSPVPTLPQEASCCPTRPWISCSPLVSAFENRVGLEASLGPVETGAGLLDFLLNPGWCWCRCIAAKRSFAKRGLLPLPVPGALISVCFEKLRWVLDPPGHVLLHFRVLVRTRQPWGSLHQSF